MLWIGVYFSAWKSPMRHNLKDSERFNWEALRASSVSDCLLFSSPPHLLSSPHLISSFHHLIIDRRIIVINPVVVTGLGQLTSHLYPNWWLLDARGATTHRAQDHPTQENKKEFTQWLLPCLALGWCPNLTIVRPNSLEEGETVRHA